MTAAPVRVLVVDDEPLIRHSLRVIIEGARDLAVVAEAATGEDAVAQAVRTRPDVVLMDIRMPGGDGLEATRRITTDPALTGTRVLVLSMFELDSYVNLALRGGASGFLLKDSEPELLVDAVRRTHAGESLFAPSILTRLVAHYLDGTARSTRSGPRRPATLTERETEVLTLVGRGLSNHEIAEALVISMGTVKTHVGNLLAKLAARDRAQLVIAAYDHGLVRAGEGG
ncbi:MAG: response regulator transcription factor [Salana multivorans]|uniref:response regulator n=1 Tax=Salana multivorans TaxID=120377 RepID=UPI000969C842|nr:response regulator transcription factor [Salana multivorans]MBN8882405.1 response regulator transcription factor [Salana multivorans]OJX97493.1 MAG: DNA-binding response regulator [Micrococcales bacterium 73-15]